MQSSINREIKTCRVFSFPSQKYRFTMQAVDPILLPYYKGSTFRGAFGMAFKKIVCALRKKECSECILKSRCIYSYIFETTPPENTNIMNMNKYNKVPHPFIIEPPPEEKQKYKEGDLISFELVLVGKAVDYLPYFIYTFEELGETGLGRGRGKYRLLYVYKGDTAIYSYQDKTIHRADVDSISVKDITCVEDSRDDIVEIEFLTPLRIVYGRKLVSDIDFHILIRNLVRRLNLLYYFHCNGRELDWDYKKIIDHAAGVAMEEKNMHWQDWERYSSRQNTRMKMGGMIGKVKYIGNLESFMSILEAGEIFHAGKGTSFGLGKYRIL